MKFVTSMFSINEHSCNTLGMYIMGHSRMGQPFWIGQCKMGQVIKESYVISSFFSSTWRFLTTDLSFQAGCSSRFNSQVIAAFVTRLVITEITELCTKVSDFFCPILYTSQCNKMYNKTWVKNFLILYL